MEYCRFLKRSLKRKDGSKRTKKCKAIEVGRLMVLIQFAGMAGEELIISFLNLTFVKRF